MNYCTRQDIISEFKKLKIELTASINQNELEKFIQENSAEINGFVSSRYITPITGVAPVAQVVQFSIDTVVDATKYTITINGTDYNFTSGIGATDLEIRDGLKASLDLNPNNDIYMTDTSGLTNEKLKVESTVSGSSFSYSNDINISNTETVANVEGDDALKILRHICIDCVSFRVVKILNLKKAAPLPDKDVIQEITEGTFFRLAKSRLKKIKDGFLALPGAVLLPASQSPVSSYGNKNNIQPIFKKDERQW